MDSLEKKLLSYISKEECVELTRKLVQIDSVIRPETGNTEHNAVLFITDWIKKELGIKPVIETVEKDRENIIAVLDSGKPGPCLILEGHTDVVSEGNSAEWTYGPFSGEIREGKIYGRGSCDMKGGLAVNLCTAKAFLKSGVPFQGKIKLAIVCDEEGMMTGIKDFIRKGHADDADAALVSEPEENQLCLSMKGALRAVITVTGRMAHGAMPLTGINPNTRLAKIILALDALEKEEIRVNGKDEFLGYPSITITVIQSPPEGEPAQLNVMPGRAVAYIDIRTIPAQDHDELKNKILKAAADAGEGDPDFHADIEFIEERPVVSMGKEEKIVKCAAQAYYEITGKEPVYNGVPGATDGTFLRAWKGIPCLVNGPGPRHMPHQKDEYIEIEELYEAARIYALTAFRYLGG